MFAIIIHNLLCKIVIHRHFKLNNHFNFRVHKWSRALEVLGEWSKDAERAAREVRRRVRSVLGDEAAPNLVDDAAVSLVGLFAGKEDQPSSGFSHAKHAEVYVKSVLSCRIQSDNGAELYLQGCPPLTVTPVTETHFSYSDTFFLLKRNCLILKSVG